MPALTTNPYYVDERREILSHTTRFEIPAETKPLKENSYCYPFGEKFVFNTVGIEEQDLKRISNSIFLDQESLNLDCEEVLESISKLQNNWDMEEASAPSKSVIDQASAFISHLNTMTQRVYQIAPGSRGEIMIELRNGAKSIEVIFYSDRTKVVDFTDPESPKQGPFNSASFLELITVLNA